MKYLFKSLFLKNRCTIRRTDFLAFNHLLLWDICKKKSDFLKYLPLSKDKTIKIYKNYNTLKDLFENNSDLKRVFIEI